VGMGVNIMAVVAGSVVTGMIGLGEVSVLIYSSHRTLTMTKAAEE
jgi:hypothetical protein